LVTQRNLPIKTIPTPSKILRRAWCFCLLSFATFAVSQTVPYIQDVVPVVEKDLSRSDYDIAMPRLLCTFTIINPDTLPFYIWVSFEGQGALRHAKRGDEMPALRLTDLEFRYKNDLSQPMVKKFPNINTSESRAKKRFGGSWLGEGRRKKGTRGKFAESNVGVDAGEDVDVYTGGSGRRWGAFEIDFWKEDAQAYYEMELWGRLYEPDLRGAIGAGKYSDVVNFEIEAMK